MIWHLNFGFFSFISMFKKIALDNGLRVITAPMAGTNTVSVLVMCGTGSDYERKEESGVSHFLEHMFFKGTKNRPTPEMIKHELDGMGSISNAFTGHEATGYYIKAAKMYEDQALKILADIYKNSLLQDEEIEREKQVVIEEMHLDKDTPTTHVWQLWEKLLYGDQPAGRDIAGEEATVRRFGRGDLRQYFDHQYVAGNTAVVVAGNIREEETIKRVKELFLDIRRSPPREKPATAIKQEEPQILAEEKKTDQTHLVVGFRGYDAFHPERYTADVMATILGGSWSSRMFSRIREKLGLAYSVFTASDSYSNRGSVVTYAGVAHENTDKALQAILEEYRKIREEKVAEEELKRVKDFIKGRMLMDLEASNAVASFVGGEEMLTQKPLTPEEVFARVEAVTPQAIQAVSRELFRPEALNLTVLGLAPDAEKLRTALLGFS